MRDNDYKTIQEYLVDNTFYYCNYPGFKKFGIITFESDGRIGGSHGQFEQRYQVVNNLLLFFNGDGKEVAEFQLNDKNERMINGKSKVWNALPLVLVRKDTKEVEVIKPAPEDDKRDLSTLLKSPYYEQVKELARSGKTVDGYDHGEYFVVNNADTPLGMDRENGIAYKIEKPLIIKDYLSKKMLVLFNAAINMMAVSAADRQAPANYYQSLQKFLPENTLLLRIADSNLISGSYYQNTENFPNYEEEIQNLIKKVAVDNGIPLSNIVCYGGSKGGIGALIHGLIGNYPIVAFDPKINREEFMQEKGDLHFCLDLVAVDFTERINGLLADTKMDAHDIKIYSSESVPMYSYIMNLNKEKCEILNVKYKKEVFNGLDDISRHIKFLNLIFPYQADYIKELFWKCDVERIR